MLSRREVIKLAGLTGSFLLTDARFLSAKTNASMLVRSIPSTKEKIPVVGLGSWQQFDVGTAENERAPLKDVLMKMNEIGGSVIDASPMYGRAEEVIGDLTDQLKLNDKFFLATKVWTTGRQE